jgi:hypothetical protein
MQTFGMKRISTDLDGPNTSISSMETMHTEITPTSKYVDVLPRRKWPQGAAKNLGGLLGIWVGSVSFEELS